ncbi:hypothetical protein [Embleya sp. NPDC059259]|uniref:hypothetical protein n=1 Tax=unclassified Embleya TaxID=2699296 RepID=UPI0036C40F0B
MTDVEYVPVVVLNGQDSDDQLLSAAYLSILFPLDPHRFLFLPHLVMQDDDRNKRVDHRLKVDGGLALMFSMATATCSSTCGTIPCRT